MKSIKITALIATILLGTNIIDASDFSALQAAKNKCLSAPWARKAQYCYAYKQLKAQTGGDSSSSQDIEEAKRACLNAPWYRKAATCYKYRQLMGAVEKDTVKPATSTTEKTDTSQKETTTKQETEKTTTDKKQEIKK